MSMYLDRLARVVAPRWSQTVGAGATVALVCNAATTAQELDTTIFQLTPPANTNGVPGDYGRAIVCFQNSDNANAIYIAFGPNNSVVANSAAVGGNAAAIIPPFQDREYEIDPKVDLWFQATTTNGGANTATLRYRITSFPSQGTPGSG